MRCVIVFLIIFICGCGPSAYQMAKADLHNQYAALSQVDNLELRKQQFREIQQRENAMDASKARHDKSIDDFSNALLIYQGINDLKW